MISYSYPAVNCCVEHLYKLFLKIVQRKGDIAAMQKMHNEIVETAKNDYLNAFILTVL